MAHQLALLYITLPQTGLYVLVYSIFILGGFAGWLLVPSYRPMQRAPFLLRAALVAMLVLGGQLVWVWAPEAIEQRFMAWLVAWDLVSAFLGGALMARFAMARSVDVWNAPNRAFIAFLPLLNLWLLLVRSSSRESDRPAPTRALVSKAASVIGGVGLITLAGATPFYVQARIYERMPLIATSESHLELTETLLEYRGLTATLDFMQTQVDGALPVHVDEWTRMTRIDVEGDTLARTYTVSHSDITQLAASFRDTIDTIVCSEPSLSALLKAGATIKETYVGTDGRTIGIHRVRMSGCEQLQCPSPGLTI